MMKLFDLLIKGGRQKLYLTIILTASASLLLYQNCAPMGGPESDSASRTKSGNYSSNIGVGGGAIGSPVGSGGIVGGDGGGATPIVGGGGGSVGGGGGGGAVIVNPGTPGSPIGGGGDGGNGVNPGGSTGGGSTLLWSYQPEDVTIEEGGVLTLGAFATKGVDIVTYQWYKDGAALSGQTGYMLRQFLVSKTAAGQYFVEARSSGQSIRSITITVKIRAARNPCPAGKWGFMPGKSFNKSNSLYHESVTGSSQNLLTLKEELADSYIIYGVYAGGSGLACINVHTMLQCRNGLLVPVNPICEDGFP